MIHRSFTRRPVAASLSLACLALAACHSAPAARTGTVARSGPGFKYYVVGNPEDVVKPTRGLWVPQGGGDDVDANYARMQVVTQQFRFQGRQFDLQKDNGPLMLNKLHLNNLHCTQGGMYISGLRTGGMLLFNGRQIQMAAELPPGTHNARPFRDGVLFNDTEANVLRYAGRDGQEDRAMRVPHYPADKLLNREMDASGIARQGFARGLAVISDSLVAGGSSPSTVSVYDLPRNERVLSVNLTMDVRNAIHGLEVWPYG